MNKLLVAINLILVAAVGILFYLQFSGKKSSSSVNTPSSNYTYPKDSSIGKHRLAYIELDSLNDNLLFLKQQRKELEAKQKRMEDELNGDARQLEERKNGFIQKNPNATPEQMQNFSAQYQRGQDSLMAKRQQMSDEMNSDRFKLMDGIQKKLKSFLADYNKDGRFQYIFTTGGGMDYLIYKDSTMDITKDVIRGMNEMMKAPAKD
ncbi:MAG: OmpH family outer membrane protein [Bacteroidetes bacterium]|nr:OmpH family outer membrane protein [Bacteroidota bacterium]